MSESRRKLHMLNIIWPVFIISSFVYAIFTGNVENFNRGIFESVEGAINLTITLLGTMCLWSGIMQIVKETSLIEKLTKFLRPIMKFLFPKISIKSEAYKEITMNIISNILGLGNAVTPLGLKAMKSMQKENRKKDTLSNQMIMFIVINTASIQIIPTTVIAIRSSLGSTNPTSIIVPVWIATVCAAIAGITAVKIFTRNEKE